MTDYLPFLNGVLFTLSTLIKYRAPRFIVWLAARMPHRYRGLTLSFLCFVFHIVCYIPFFWLVSLVLFLLSEYFPWLS